VKHVKESALFLAQLIVTFICKISVKQALHLTSNHYRMWLFKYLQITSIRKPFFFLRH